MKHDLTDEQKEVINHPLGSHARVLAVAGSGKTTTMVYWTHHLIMNHKVDPKSIRILMFNALARNQFREKINDLISDPNQRPQVHTFHSFSYQVIQEAIARKILPEKLDKWLEEKEEQVRWSLFKVIQNLERQEYIEPGDVDVDLAMTSISLWKGSLIPPDRAGHRTNPNIPLVYKDYEHMRNDASAITYDDFVPIVVELLESEDKIKELYIGKARVVIVDEYQDVNYGQHRLVELLAGDHADVMVVGDDDQTIYEWRGARPEYILTKYKKEFSNRPSRDYMLSHSFRFGPEIADSADRVINNNNKRAVKHLRADDLTKPAFIKVIRLKSAYEITKQLTGQAIDLVKNKKITPTEIIVLGRMYAQLHGIQAEFLVQGIPFKVVGMQPFYNRHEIQVLLGYFKVALDLKTPLTPTTLDDFMSILNSPNRRINKVDTETVLFRAIKKGVTLEDALEAALSSPMSPFTSHHRTRLQELLTILQKIHRNLTLPSGQLIGQIVDDVDYFNYFDDYYGEGEQSFERKQSVLSFISFANELNLGPEKLIDHIENLDTTLGAEEEDIIKMTTIFRTKGLEFDYVIIPDCVDGYLPCTYENEYPIYDTSGIIEAPDPTPRIESERRLFYVAVTRAREGVYIGALKDQPSQFLEEMDPNNNPARRVAEPPPSYGKRKSRNPWDDVR